MSESLKNVMLVITDISGYTEYMLATKTALDHSRILMTELMETILKKLESPFEVAKLEGDAVFVYVVKDEKGQVPDQNKVKERLTQLFSVFKDKLKNMTLCHNCTCGACANMDKLRLKIVAHSGQVAHHKIGPFVELTGVDVIVVHRLLKNTIPSHEYLLLTEPAFQDLAFGKNPPFLSTEQTYDAIGAVKGYYQLGEVFN